MMELAYAIITILLGAGGLALIRVLSVKCPPNQVIVISGGHKTAHSKRSGYRLIASGSALYVPGLESVHTLDLKTQLIELETKNLLTAAGIPVTMSVIAGVKITREEPGVHQAVERLLGKSRGEIAQLVKAMLEARLRALVVTMTPKQIVESKQQLAERIERELGSEIMSLGMVVDTIRVNDVIDSSGYLESDSRAKTAGKVSEARIEAAKARCQATVHGARNFEREVEAIVESQILAEEAEHERRLKAIDLRKDAVVSELKSSVNSEISLAKAELDIQRARIEQVRAKLEAEVVVPARAAARIAEEQARAAAAKIEQAAESKAEAIKTLSESWERAGGKAAEAMMVQKMDKIVEAAARAIANKEEGSKAVVDYRHLQNPIGEGVPITAPNEQSLSIGYPPDERRGS